MSKNEDEQEHKEKKQEKEPAKDLVQIYMDNLRRMSEVESASMHYRLLIQSINIGKALLREHEELKQKASKFLESSNNYPEERQMELTEGRYYRMGGKGTGSIVVRPEELEIGAMEAINQQSDLLMPKLKLIDNQIFTALIEEGWIKRKNQDMKEYMDQILFKKLKKRFGVEIRE